MNLSDLLNLSDSHEWAGEWWLPNESEKKIPGILHYDPEKGLKLTLIGSIESRIMTLTDRGTLVMHEGSQTWEMLHGVAEQREITLLECIPTKSLSNIGARVKSPDKQTVMATKALIGVHLDNPDERAFSALEVSIEDLTHWSASSPFQTSLGIPKDKWDGRAKISVIPVEDKSVTVKGIDFRLNHLHTQPYYDYQRGETIGRMRHIGFIKVIPSTPISLIEAIKNAHSLQSLISFATHRDSGVIWLQLDLFNEEPESEENRPSVKRTVQVLYSPSVIGKHEEPATRNIDGLFTCATLPFEEVIPRWFETYEKLQVALNMILGLRYAPARFIESNLLTTVNAAEILHRDLNIDEIPVPANVFKKIRQAMVAQVSEEYRNRFKGMIRNDPTLRDRLYALAARPDQEAITRIIPDIDQWAKLTTQARNNLTHQGKTPRHSFEQLIAIIEATKAVIVFNVLAELGLSVEVQREVAQSHPQLRLTARRAQEWLITPS